MNFLFDKDTWQEIYSSIRKNKMRTGITIIGVMWGIFLLVVLLGAAKGVENNFNKLFGNFATNSVFIWAQQTSKPFKGFQEGKSLTLKKQRVSFKGISTEFMSKMMEIVSSKLTINEAQSKNLLSTKAEATIAMFQVTQLHATIVTTWFPASPNFRPKTPS